MPSRSKENLIGRGIRQRRRQIGLTQETLAEALGISYQQVQKYENGMSRLTVGRLQQIASVLRVPFDHLLKDIPIVKESSPSYGGPSAEEKRLIKAFRAIPNPSTRKAILRVVQSVSLVTMKKSSK